MDYSLCATFDPSTDMLLVNTSLHTSDQVDIAFASESSFDDLINLLRELGDPSLPISSSLLFSLAETVGCTTRLPHVLKTLRVWRTLEREDRFSRDTLMRLALDLSRVLDGGEKGDDETASAARIKWISQDYWQETQPEIEAPGVIDALDRPPSVSSRPSSASGRCARHQHATAAYRSGCSACRLPRHPVPPPVPFLPPSLSVRSHNVLSSRRSIVLKPARDENTNPSTSVPALSVNSTRPRSRSLPRKPSSLPVKSSKPRRTIFGQLNVWLISSLEFV